MFKLYGFLTMALWTINVLAGLVLMGTFFSGIWILLFESISKGGAMIGLAFVGAIVLQFINFIVGLIMVAMVKNYD